MVITMKEMLASHPFLKDLPDRHLEVLSGCASNVAFEQGQQIFKEGGEANQFFLIRHGKVAIETYSPGRGSICIQTIGEGEVLGWSWIIPPYKWLFDTRAVELTRAFAIHTECLRGHCEEDKDFGYEMTQRFMQVTVRRLRAALVQLVDLYGDKH